MEIHELKKKILKAGSNPILYGELIPELLLYVNEYYETIYNIQSKYDSTYIPYEKEILFGLYNPFHKTFRVTDFNENTIELSYKYYRDIGCDYVIVVLSWQELIDFNPIKYEWDICSEVREAIFKELTKTQNKLHELFKSITENDVEHFRLKTLIEKI